MTDTNDNAQTQTNLTSTVWGRLVGVTFLPSPEKRTSQTFDGLRRTGYLRILRRAMIAWYF